MVPDICFLNTKYILHRVIKGKPTPEITWKFISKDDSKVSMLPEGVIVEEALFKITAAQSEQNGVYRCYATNSEGHHSAEIAVAVQCENNTFFSLFTNLIMEFVFLFFVLFLNTCRFIIRSY